MGNIITGRIHETALWIDFEGGHAKHKLWDASMVVDSTESTLHAIRFAMITDNKLSNSKLKSSLPKTVFDSMKVNKCSVIKYKFEHEKWLVDEVKNTNTTITNTFAQYIPDSTQYILAWNMKAHDAKILASLLPKAQLEKYSLLDPLLWFRKHFSLPSNSLGKSGPGTPRKVMRAGDYSYLGKAHTSFVDTLHMRDVTLNAAIELTTGQSNLSPGFKAVHDAFMQDETKQNVTTIAKNQKKAPEHNLNWMSNEFYWDENEKLKKEHSKAFKKRLIRDLQKAGHELTKEQKCSIHASQKQATFKKYLTNSWVHVT